MQRFQRLLTSLVFAAHALLGCGVHHICLHRSAVEQAAHPCAHHGGPASHADDSADSSEHHPCPTHNCHHVACSFVKADTVRIDQGDHQLSPLAVPVRPAEAAAAPARLAASGRISSANWSPPQLYVWHCALLI